MILIGRAGARPCSYRLARFALQGPILVDLGTTPIVQPELVVHHMQRIRLLPKRLDNQAPAGASIVLAGHIAVSYWKLYYKQHAPFEQRCAFTRVLPFEPLSAVLLGNLTTFAP